MGKNLAALQFLPHGAVAQAAERMAGRRFPLPGAGDPACARVTSIVFTAWVFLPDHWRAICAPVYPLTISVVMKSIPLCGTSSTILVNRRREASGELWQERFFDRAPLPVNIFVAGRRRALRTVKEYSEKVEYIHLNPVKAGLVQRSEDWRRSSVKEYSGVSAAEQERRCGLTIDRVNMPSDPGTRI